MTKFFLTIKNENTDEVTIDIEGFIGETWYREEGEKQNTLNRIKNELNKITASKAKTIKVNIHSLGGDVDAALAIHDVLKTHSAKIITSITGMCASAGTIIFSCGDERIMSDNALFLIHKCSSLVWGNENALQEGLEAQKTVNERIVNIYLKNSTKTKEEIEDLMGVNNGNGKWITASEAKDFGFVTEIILQEKKVACIDKATFLNSKLPNVPKEFEDMIQNEKDSETLWDRISKFIDEKFGNSATQNHNTHIEMKKLFPLLSVVLAFADDTAFDKEKGFSLSEDQLKKIEDSIKNLETLKTENQTLKDEAKKLQDKAKQDDDEIKRLKALVDNVPNTPKPVDGTDTPPTTENSFEDQMKTNPNYQAAAADLGFEL